MQEPNFMTHTLLSLGICKPAPKSLYSYGGMAMQLLIKFIWALSIVVISYAFSKAMALRKKIPGGIASQAWQFLYHIIGLLLIGYLTMPLFSRLPEQSREFIFVVVSLAAAIFIVKVINLFYKVIKEVGL
jgi:hypothetical protein